MLCCDTWFVEHLASRTGPAHAQNTEVSGHPKPHLFFFDLAAVSSESALRFGGRTTTFGLLPLFGAGIEEGRGSKVLPRYQ